MISKALRNLISNGAISGNEININAQRMQSEIVISVSEYGKGITETRIRNSFASIKTIQPPTHPRNKALAWVWLCINS